MSIYSILKMIFQDQVNKIKQKEFDHLDYEFYAPDPREGEPLPVPEYVIGPIGIADLDDGEQLAMD